MSKAFWWDMSQDQLLWWWMKDRRYNTPKISTFARNWCEWLLIFIIQSKNFHGSNSDTVKRVFIIRTHGFSFFILHYNGERTRGFPWWSVLCVAEIVLNVIATCYVGKIILGIAPAAFKKLLSKWNHTWVSILHVQAAACWI